jgi:hypothetical protein
LLEDVEIGASKETTNIYSDILTEQWMRMLLISNNMNTIMKQMTSISIILMIPTLIARNEWPKCFKNNRYRDLDCDLRKFGFAYDFWCVFIQRKNGFKTLHL